MMMNPEEREESFPLDDYPHPLFSWTESLDHFDAGDEKTPWTREECRWWWWWCSSSDRV